MPKFWVLAKRSSLKLAGGATKAMRPLKGEYLLGATSYRYSTAQKAPLGIKGSTKRAPCGTELRRRLWRKQAVAAEGERGAKTQDGYTELRSCQSLSRGCAVVCQSLRHGYAVPPPFDSKGRLWDRATSYGCPATQKAPLCKGDERGSAASGAHEGRAQCAKQAVVSPMSKGVLQAVGRSRTTIAN